MNAPSAPMTAETSMEHPAAYFLPQLLSCMVHCSFYEARVSGRVLADVTRGLADECATRIADLLPPAARDLTADVLHGKLRLDEEMPREERYALVEAMLAEWAAARSPAPGTLHATAPQPAASFCKAYSLSTLPEILAQIVQFAQDDYQAKQPPALPDEIAWNVAYTCACFLAQHTADKPVSVAAAMAYEGLQVTTPMPYMDRVSLAAQLVGSVAGGQGDKAPSCRALPQSIFAQVAAESVRAA